MDEFPRVIIIMLTYKRTEYAIRTAASVSANLRYAGKVHWIICDDGSPDPHVNLVSDAANQGVISTMRHNQIGYGGMANAGWEAARGISPITFWLEDDWELSRPLDITPYVRLLMERLDVGMVRLGHMPIDLELESMGYDGRMYLEVSKSRQYAFSGNPHLKHQRFLVYGSYPTGPNPGDTEIAYDHQVRTREGPAIWWPLSIGDDPPFSHIGEVQSYESLP